MLERVLGVWEPTPNPSQEGNVGSVGEIKKYISLPLLCRTTR
ncbi:MULTISPECIES: hypothetical protein [unclassified Okeania]|nr:MULTISPECIES: hypothetical protein [unclassified Okeania]